MDKTLMLRGVIEAYENDFCCGYEGKDKDELNTVILNLIVEMARLANDIRYCSKKECSCSPESGIKRIMNKYDEDLSRVIFRPYGLTNVNMMKVYGVLLNLD